MSEPLCSFICCSMQQLQARAGSLHNAAATRAVSAEHCLRHLDIS